MHPYDGSSGAFYSRWDPQYIAHLAYLYRQAEGVLTRHFLRHVDRSWWIIRVMNDTTSLPQLPDRLSIDPSSPFHNRDVFQREIGIRFNDKDRHDVEEYCISEGWIKVAAGRTLDRKGKPMLIKLKGKVEAYYK